MTIEEACKKFLENLGTNITSPTVFILLDDIARKQGLTLVAEQRGIRGTVLYFGPLSEKQQFHAAYYDDADKEML